MSNIKVWLDGASNAAVFQIPALGQGGMVFVNEMKAILGDIPDTCSIINMQRGSDSDDFLEVYDRAYTDFVDEADQPHGNSASSTVDALNAILQRSGSSLGDAPVITSSTTVNLTSGDTLNYELTADNGVGFEWSNLPTGVVTVEGNVRKLIGGSTLATGTYTATARAVNYFGEDTQDIDFVVAAPPYSNTKSVNFSNGDYLGANAALLDDELGRAGNGSGSGDAWTIAFWFKPGTATNANQTILYFGGQIVSNEGYVQVKYDGNLTTGQNITLRYGTNNNRLELKTSPNSLTIGSWSHVIVTYDGGTTGAASDDVDDYYSRFSIVIDGVVQSTSNSHNNYGYTGSVEGDNFRLGRWNNGQSLRNNCRIDELAVWGSDQSSNIASIYNSGSTHDLSLLSPAPDHYWRMGDDDSYPIIQDVEGSAVFVMYNMTSSDIVSDVP